MQNPSRASVASLLRSRAFQPRHHPHLISPIPLLSLPHCLLLLLISPYLGRFIPFSLLFSTIVLVSLEAVRINAYVQTILFNSKTLLVFLLMLQKLEILYCFTLNRTNCALYFWCYANLLLTLGSSNTFLRVPEYLGILRKAATTPLQALYTLLKMQSSSIQRELTELLLHY